MSKAYKIIQKLASHTFEPALRTKIWQWLTNSSYQTEKEEALFSIWNEYPLDASQSTYQSFRKTHEKIRNSQKQDYQPTFAKKLLRVAAILIIPLISIVASYLYVHTHSADTEMVQCFVPEGDRKNLTLPDGSTVNINSGSILIYPTEFKGNTRSVYLVGEANFSVQKDKEHPFTVHTSHIKVQALGTKFNVQAYTESDKIITTLESGAVKVDKITADNNSFILSPNEQLEYNYRTGLFEKRQINATSCSGWTRGELNFTNQPLKEILATLQREYAVQFVLNSRLLTPDLYTIKFPQHENIHEIMNILTLTVGGISYEIEDNIISIYSLKKRGGK